MLLVKGAILHLEETALWLLGLLAGMHVDVTVSYQILLPGGRREAITQSEVLETWVL